MYNKDYIFFSSSRSYYGQCASPDRFLDAVLSIIKANVALDRLVTKRNKNYLLKKISLTKIS